MLAKDLAAQLLKNPDFEVKLRTITFEYEGELRNPVINDFAVTGIADIGYSSKNIMLEVEEED